MRILLFICLFLYAGAAFSFQNEQRLSNQKEELRAENLFHEIRCMVCKGESLAESNAGLAVDMRAVIRSKVLHGESDVQIKKYLVDHYGESILQKPTFMPDTYFLWLAPVFLLIIGVIIILRIVRVKKYFKFNSKNGRRS